MIWFNVCWIIKLYDLYSIELPTEYKDNIQKFINQKSNNLQAYDVQELYYFSVLLKLNSDDTPNIALEKTVTDLFYSFDNNSEDTYIKSSNLFLHIISNMDVSYLSDRGVTLVKELNNYALSKSIEITDLEKQILLAENLALSCNILGIPIPLENVDQLTQTIDNSMNLINAEDSYNPITFSNVNRFFDLCSIFGIENDFKFKINTERLEIDDDLLYTDLQSYYRLVALRNKMFLELEFPNALYGIKYWLYQTYPPTTDIESMYYGYIIAEELDIKIDLEKYCNYLNKLIDKAKSNNNLSQFYYLYLIYSALGIDAKEVDNYIENNFSNLSFAEFIEMDYRTQYFFLYLDHILKRNFFNQNKNEIEDLYFVFKSNNFIEENKVNFYYYMKIVELLQLNIGQKNEIISYFNDIYEKEEYTSIYQTYRQIELCQLLNIDIPYNKIQILIEETKSEFGTFYISSTEKSIDSITLRSIYEGLVIENLIK